MIITKLFQKKKESKELSIENISMNTRLLHYLKKEKKKKDRSLY